MYVHSNIHIHMYVLNTCAHMHLFIYILKRPPLTRTTVVNKILNMETIIHLPFAGCIKKKKKDKQIARQASETTQAALTRKPLVRTR